MAPFIEHFAKWREQTGRTVKLLLFFHSRKLVVTYNGTFFLKVSIKYHLAAGYQNIYTIDSTVHVLYTIALILSTIYYRQHSMFIIQHYSSKILHQLSTVDVRANNSITILAIYLVRYKLSTVDSIFFIQQNIH